MLLVCLVFFACSLIGRSIDYDVGKMWGGELSGPSVTLRPLTPHAILAPLKYKTNTYKDDSAKPIFLAIASAPTGEAPKPVTTGKKKAVGDADFAAGPEFKVPVPATWEFLVKGTEFNSWITSISPGSELSISQVMGSGFPIAENVDGFKYDFPTQNLILFATGSGIAPIRSAIESDQLGIGKGRTCTLYYGVRTPDDLSYVSKFPLWEQGGVSVVPVISQPDLGGNWMGRTGYVQNALEEDGVPIPRNSAALLCGVNGMVDSVKAMLLDSGVFEGRVLKNF